MTENLTITTERVDDIPLLLAQMERMGLPDLLDERFPTHGNWQGLSQGWLASIWLAHVLSQQDHRLSHVQPWAEHCLLTLHRATGKPLRPLDFTDDDDRLANLLRLFSDDERWRGFEAALNRQLLRVYDLQAQRVRLDTTSASGYWQVTPDGLFQFGHSKDKRPDLPQLKVLLATLDPLALPLVTNLVTNVVAGGRADDPLYCPAIKAVRSSLGRRGLLYVGDSKMASLSTRAYIHGGHDFYLTPLPEKQLPSDWLCQYLGPVHSGQVQTETIKRGRADGQLVEIAIGYERLVQIESELDGLMHRWQERRLVVRSLSAAKTAEDGLYKRLAQAEQELHSLNERGRGKKRPDNRGAVDEAVAAVLQHYRVGELLLVSCEEQVSERVVRSYKGQPARVKSRWDFSLLITRDEEALQRTVAGLGWRVYATNQAASELSLEGAVLAYREEYLIEASFGRLKGVPLSLRPFYLQRDDHAKGLVRLLGLGLRVLSLLEFVVRRQLAAGGGSLAGLYKGQPQAATARPTAERLLESFRDLTLSRVELAGQVLYHLTPLSKLQLGILELLGFSPRIYTKLTGDSSQPP